MSRRSIVLTAGVLGILVALAIAAPLGARPAQVKTRITVTETDSRIVLSKKIVPHGELVFTIFNRGKRTHNFKISYRQTLPIGPGKTGRLVIVLAKGLWHYRSTLDSDASRGMRGILRLT